MEILKTTSDHKKISSITFSARNVDAAHETSQVGGGNHYKHCDGLEQEKVLNSIRRLGEIFA